MKDDQYFLAEAAKAGKRQAPPRDFGAVVVKDGEIIAADCNHVHELSDPSAHAELSTLRKAAAKLGTYNLEGCTLYGSHEPCLMCFSCAAWARIDRVVYAVPADEQTDFSYEFTGVNLQELATHLTRPIKVELVRLT